MLRSLMIVGLMTSLIQASPLTFTFGPGGTQIWGLAFPPPLVLDFSVAKVGETDPFVQWLLPIEEESEELQIWTLDESNAASYGVDWSVMEDAFVNTEGNRYRQNLTSFSTGKPWPDVEPYPVFETIDSIEFHLHFYISSISFSGAMASYKIIGDGKTVPEPNSILLILPVILLILVLLLTANRRRSK